MKFNSLSKKRQDVVSKNKQIEINGSGDIVFKNTEDIVPNIHLYNFFEFNNV